MSTPAHILSGAYMGVLAAHVVPAESSYLIIAAISSGIFDIDHVYYLIRDWRYYKKNGLLGTLHHARSVFHELLGFTLISFLMFLLSFSNLKLALVIGIPAMIHLIEDMIMGKSFPFAPFEKSEIVLIPQKGKLKVYVDVIVILIFSLLWIRFLNGA